MFSLKRDKAVLNEIVKYKSQNLHFEQNWIRMWDMATQTKLAATVCDFYLRVFACTSTAFDGWGSSKDQKRQINCLEVFDCCSQSLATLRYVADNEAAKTTANAQAV